MSEYTPTAQEVRDAYRYETGSDGCSVRGDDAFGEFDRWLVAHDAEARKELLREAEAAVRSGAIEDLKHRLNASPIGFRKGYAEGAMTAGVSIRALAEGDTE